MTGNWVGRGFRFVLEFVPDSHETSLVMSRYSRDTTQNQHKKLNLYRDIDLSRGYSTTRFVITIIGLNRTDNLSKF